MSKFNITATATCPECDTMLSSSDEEHECVPWEKEEHSFVRIGTGETYTVEATSVNAAWRRLARETGDPVPWIHESGEVSASYYQRKGDLRDL